MEEVKRAVWDIGSENAPGPMDSPSLSSKKIGIP